jgi:hypothetical protein
LALANGNIRYIAATPERALFSFFHLAMAVEFNRYDKCWAL